MGNTRQVSGVRSQASEERHNLTPDARHLIPAFKRRWQPKRSPSALAYRGVAAAGRLKSVGTRMSFGEDGLVPHLLSAQSCRQRTTPRMTVVMNLGDQNLRPL